MTLERNGPLDAVADYREFGGGGKPLQILWLAIYSHSLEFAV